MHDEILRLNEEVPRLRSEIERSRQALARAEAEIEEQKAALAAQQAAFEERKAVLDLQLYVLRSDHQRAVARNEILAAAVREAERRADAAGGVPASDGKG